MIEQVERITPGAPEHALRPMDQREMTGATSMEIAKGRRDAMGLALLTLAQEVWVIKDRQLVSEAILQAHGLLGEIDRHQPDAALAQKIAVERERFIGAITTIMLTGKPAES